MKKIIFVMSVIASIFGGAVSMAFAQNVDGAEGPYCAMNYPIGTGATCCQIVDGKPECHQVPSEK